MIRSLNDCVVGIRSIWVFWVANTSIKVIKSYLNCLVGRLWSSGEVLDSLIEVLNFQRDFPLFKAYGVLDLAHLKVTRNPMNTLDLFGLWDCGDGYFLDLVWAVSWLVWFSVKPLATDLRPLRQKSSCRRLRPISKWTPYEGKALILGLQRAKV